MLRILKKLSQLAEKKKSTDSHLGNILWKNLTTCARGPFLPRLVPALLPVLLVVLMTAVVTFVKFATPLLAMVMTLLVFLLPAAVMLTHRSNATLNL